MMRIIDCDYLFPRYAASYLLVEQGRAAFVENNTAHAVPKLLAALEREGLKPEQVDYLVVTHVHLDHAGGSSELIRHCPNAVLLAHPRAARHLIDPSKLVASATSVYGPTRFHELYGTISPIAADRVRAIEDGETLSWGRREWRFEHLRGHANHHLCLWDSALEGVFTGDTFGIAYPDLQKGGCFIFPSTSPTDFDPQAARQSVKRIAGSSRRAFLTHFGEVSDLRTAADQLLEWLDFSEQVMESATRSAEPDEKLADLCLSQIDARFRRALERHGLSSGDAWVRLQTDRELNAQGIAYAAQKLRIKKGT